MKTILIIEDNEDVRENTADILELAGYNVTTAENGKKGVEMAKNLYPDIILCDIMMPELDGYEVLKIISQYKKIASIPFIFLTAKTGKIDMRKGMNLGADDYLTKPFNEEELLGAIESRLNKHDFLKKEFSSSIGGVSQFIEEASKFMELDHLSRDYKLLKYNRKEIIFREGCTSNFLYYIESGVVKTFKTTEKGKQMVTGLHNNGHFLGQLSISSDNSTYIESATVLEPAEIYEIPKLDFINLINSNSDVANKFVCLISNKLVDIKNQLVNIAFSTVRQRLALALLDIHDKEILMNLEDNSIIIAREDLAGIIGTATETAIRMLTEFKTEGIIKIGPTREIIIKDKETLENIALYG